MKRSGAVSVVILLLLGCGPQNNAQRAISKGAKAMKPNVKAVTVDVPVARNRPWPMPGVVATGLNKALTGLRAGSTLTVRLSVPRDAGTNPGMELIGTVDVESGILTVRTECGCFEFLPNSRFRVKDLKGNVTTSGEIEPAGQNPVDIWAQFGRAAKMTAEGPVSCERGVFAVCGFGTRMIARDSHGHDIDLDATNQALPYELTGSRGFITLTFSASSDFKGTVGDFGIPSYQ